MPGLIRVRFKHGWSQAELGRHLGVSGATISRWESGARTCRYPHWLTLALERLEAEADAGLTNGMSDLQDDEWVDPEV
jgi:transcriptional regulator with XRE-family HTH domain